MQCSACSTPALVRPAPPSGVAIVSRNSATQRRVGYPCCAGNAYCSPEWPPAGGLSGCVLEPPKARPAYPPLRCLRAPCGRCSARRWRWTAVPLASCTPPVATPLCAAAAPTCYCTLPSSPLPWRARPPPARRRSRTALSEWPSCPCRALALRRSLTAQKLGAQAAGLAPLAAVPRGRSSGTRRSAFSCQTAHCQAARRKVYYVLGEPSARAEEPHPDSASVTQQCNCEPRDECCSGL